MEDLNQAFDQNISQEIKVEQNDQIEKTEEKKSENDMGFDLDDVELLDMNADDHPEDPYEAENPNKIYSPLVSRFRALDASKMDDKLIEVEKEELKFKTQKRVSSVAARHKDDIIKYNTDKASLGSKSFKNNTPYKRQRNAMIDAARHIHKDATAYTLETYDKINNLKKERSEAAGKRTISDEERRTALINRLMRVNFTTQMFYSTNIRNNLSLYLSYIYDYDEAMSIESDTGAADLEKLKVTMNIFKERVRIYCETNKVTLDGKAVTADHKAEKLAPRMIHAWASQLEVQKKSREYTIKRDENSEVPAQETYGEAEPQIMDLALVSTTEQRIKNVNKLGVSIKLIQDKIDLIERSKEYKKKYGKSPEDQADYKAYVSEYAFLVKQKALYTAYFALAYKENRFLTTDEVSEEECKSAWEDLCAIEESFDKYDYERFLKDRKVRMSRTVDHQTKGDSIIDLDSVTSSAAAREEMLGKHETRIREMIGAEAIDEKEKKKMLSLADTLRDCLKHDMFYKGRADEISYIKILTKMAKSYYDDKGSFSQESVKAIESLYNDLKDLTSGTMVYKEGAEFIDATEHEPQNAGEKFKGYDRNTVLQSISYYSNEKDTPLFAHEPTALDFRQNIITDCYLCSAVTSLVEMSPQYIRSMMKDNEDGTVTVRLFRDAGKDKDMEPVYFKVKKTIPKIAGGDYASGGALWMQMIEKAFAVYGNTRPSGNATMGYAGLWYGTGYNVLKILTGNKGRQDETLNIDRDAEIGFEQMMDWKQANKIYTAGSRADATMVQPGHAYAVLGGRIENGQRLVKLRNPYSRASTDYEYGKDAEKVSKRGNLGTMDFLGGEDNDFGVFEMKYEDFKREFATVWSNDFGGVQ